jgi:hypothetical protein
MRSAVTRGIALEGGGGAKLFHDALPRIRPASTTLHENEMDRCSVTLCSLLNTEQI